jgi:heme-degrading monooxygenase HmoA
MLNNPGTIAGRATESQAGRHLARRSTTLAAPPARSMICAIRTSSLGHDQPIADRRVAAIGRQTMFIAMNRFRVKKGSEEAFERVWLTRETYLDRVPGFVEFHLLKGPEAEDHTLYASHTVWQSKSAFEAWTRSEEFRAAHARAGNETTGPLYLEHPKFEGFEVRQTVERKASVA